MIDGVIWGNGVRVIVSGCVWCCYVVLFHGVNADVAGGVDGCRC